MTRFFVPGAEGEEAEAMWQRLHAASEEFMGRPVPNDRIYSITFNHDGVEYTATVGERRRATKYRRTRSGHKDLSRPPQTYRDGNEVQAIFAGDPYLVWEVPAPASAWNNPAMAGRPKNVVAFEG